MFLRNHLLKLGFYLGGSNSQIIPLITGSEANTIWLRNALEKEDIYGAVFCAPATPKNNALIRLSISANHSQENLIKVIDCLAKLDRKKHPLPLFAGYLEDQ